MEPAPTPTLNIPMIPPKKLAMRPNKSDYHTFPFILSINIKKIMHKKIIISHIILKL